MAPEDIKLLPSSDSEDFVDSVTSTVEPLATRRSWKLLVSGGFLLLGLLGFAAHSLAPRPNSTHALRATLELESEETAGDVIDRIFAKHGVGSRAGGVLKANRLATSLDVKLTGTSAMCSSVDWHTISGVESDEVQKQLKSLYVQEMCDPATGKAKDDPTCKAIFAVIEARVELNKRFPEGPKMMSYMKSNWYKGVDGHFATWGSASDPDDVVANTGSGLCDIIRAVLNQVNDQMGTSTCGPTSVLASLILNEPAQAVKVAMKLMWEGEVSGLPQAPCDYIYNMEPGMVPLKEMACGDHCSADEVAAGSNNHPMGLQGAFTQIALASYAKAVNSKWHYYSSEDVCSHDNTLLVACGKADGCTVEPGSGKPPQCNVCGLDVDHRSDLDSAIPVDPKVMAHFSGPAAIKYLCNYVFGSGPGSCKYAFTLNKCGDLEPSLCREIFEMEGLTGDDLKTYIEPWALEQSPPYFIKETLPAGKKRVDAYLEKVHKANAKEAILGSIMPSITEDILEEICAAKHVMLWVNSNPINGKSIDECASVPCNHWITIPPGCKKDDAKIDVWSWGFTKAMPREYLLRCTCGAVIHA
jgi:hypothetical protein